MVMKKIMMMMIEIEDLDNLFFLISVKNLFKFLGCKRILR